MSNSSFTLFSLKVEMDEQKSYQIFILEAASKEELSIKAKKLLGKPALPPFWSLGL